MGRIPRIIHYCWFGKNEKPDIVIDCINSWRRFFVGWKIIEWNESNYDLESIQYAKDAYMLGKWAFVSDVVRLDVLYRYGGIYLDVDVEFIKPLPECLLETVGFMGFEYTNTIAPGLIFGVEKRNPFVCKILLSYENEHFCINKNGIYRTINMRITDALEAEGLRKNGEYQVVLGFHILPAEYFCGYNTDIREPEITEKTICWHHYLSSWQSKSLKTRIQDRIKKFIGIRNYVLLLHGARSLRRIYGATGNNQSKNSRHN